MKKTRQRGVSLVVTLMCIVVLTIIVVAFLQSMSLERRTSQSYSNVYRAELAAESAQQEAVTRLGSLMAAMPYHAVGYTNVLVNTGTGSTNQLFTIFYGSTNATNQPIAYFLCSTTNTNAAYTALANVPSVLTLTNSTPVNRRTMGADTNNPDAGWMGSPVATNGSIVYRECRAPWVYVLRNASLPHQPNRSAANYNPYIARYAWWIEDETSKIDISLAGNKNGAGGGFLPAQATNAFASTNTNFQDAQLLSPSQMDLGAIPINNGQPIATNAPAVNSALITFRETLTNLPHDGHILARGPGSTNSENKARFYITMGSVANDLAGNGMRRVNLNALVTEGVASTNTIASDLDDIAYVITGRHLFSNLDNAGDQGFFHDLPNTNTALLPNFGNRFWPSTDNRIALSAGFSNDEKRDIYLTKIAANIRDYIDSDNMPTFVDRDGKVFAGSDPGSGGPPPDGVFPSTPTDDSRNNYKQPRAIGKEAIPYLVKCGWGFQTVGSDLYFDHFLTFFNPSTKEFKAPPGTFLRVYKRMSWGLGGFGQKPMKNYEFDLTDVVFPAGEVVVITAQGAASPPGGSYGATLLGGPGTVKYLPIKPSPSGADAPGSPAAQEGTRKFTAYVTSGSAGMEPRGGDHDYFTHMMWGNSNGYYGGYGALTITQAQKSYSMPPGQQKSTATTMRGNDAASHTGDARSIEEPLTLAGFYLTGNSNGDQDQYRFYSDSSATILTTVLNGYIYPPGGIPNPIGAMTLQWPDYTSQFDNSRTTTYAIIRDEPMTSIAELGFIYDPYRRNGNDAAGANGSGYIDYARGGGRSLRIGQPDDVIVNGNGRPADMTSAATAPRFTANWANAAWRLTDIFDVVWDANAPPATLDRTNAVAPAQSRGKININSAIRDNGQAVRSLLRGFHYLSNAPHTDPSIANRALAAGDIDNLIGQLQNYLNSKGPMMERGELSQLAFFANGTAATRSMTTTADRAREEIFRRILPMVTTRSSSFSVFAVGQALREDNGGKVYPVAESLKGSVFRVDPSLSTPRSAATNYSATKLYDRF